MPRKFNAADGLIPADLVHCGIDHLSASRLLFKSDPRHFDAAGYLTHIGVELLLKGWLLESVGNFHDRHDLMILYDRLVSEAGASQLTDMQRALLAVLNNYGELRYPNRKRPTEIGNENWLAIEVLVDQIVHSMPASLELAIGMIASTNKAGRVLMKKPIV